MTYIGVGLCFLAGAIATHGRHDFRYPLRHPLAVRLSAVAAGAAVIACALVLHGMASSLSPGLLARNSLSGAGMGWEDRAIGLFPRPATRLLAKARRVLESLALLYLSPEGERPVVIEELRSGGERDRRSDGLLGIGDPSICRRATGSRGSPFARFRGVMMRRLLTLARSEARQPFGLRPFPNPARFR